MYKSTGYYETGIVLDVVLHFRVHFKMKPAYFPALHCMDFGTPRIT